ncbi:MAG TPA: hypothetical protein PKC18_20715, partial [Lacipirellulaceae bacterium]|nr:hypothetical protein [Lacipirellulaceae bacterium]
MLRFESGRRGASRDLGPSRARIWALLGLLLAVTMLIRQLSRPEAADRLGHVLAMTPASEAGPAGDAPHVFDAETPAEEEVNVEAPAWQQLRDNAPFLTQENIAWQQLLSRAQGATGRTSQTP